MYIMNQMGSTIHRSCDILRFYLTLKDDAVLIQAYLGENIQQPSALGRYKNTQEAKDVLKDLFYALASDSEYFEMPDSPLLHEEPWIRDSRIKRRGGS